MKAIAAAFVALFVLWVVDVNFNGGRYTDAAMRMIRPGLIDWHSKLRPPQFWERSHLDAVVFANAAHASRRT